jgi:hypothetical protein
MAPFNRRHITGAFEFAQVGRVGRRSGGSRSRSMIKRSKSLILTKPFDLVFAGSITSHLCDPLRGLDRFGVTTPGGTCIVSAPFVDADEQTPTLMIGHHPNRLVGNE